MQHNGAELQAVEPNEKMQRYLRRQNENLGPRDPTSQAEAPATTEFGPRDPTRRAKAPATPRARVPSDQTGLTQPGPLQVYPTSNPSSNSPGRLRKSIFLLGVFSTSQQGFPMVFSPPYQLSVSCVSNETALSRGLFGESTEFGPSDHNQTGGCPGYYSQMPFVVL